MAVTGRTDGPLAGVLHSTQVGRAPKARAMRTSFLLGVLLFVAILPLILLLRRPKQGAAAPAHIEME